MTNPPIVDATPNDAPKGIIVSDRVYDVLKDVDLVILPAAGTAYAATAGILHLPYALEVVGLIGVAVFIIGVLLKISNVQHKAAIKVAVAQAVAQGATVTEVGDTTVVQTAPTSSMDPRNVTG